MATIIPRPGVWTVGDYSAGTDRLTDRKRGGPTSNRKAQNFALNRTWGKGKGACALSNALARLQERGRNETFPKLVRGRGRPVPWQAVRVIASARSEFG